jgi:hypothetical protein
MPPSRWIRLAALAGAVLLASTAALAQARVQIRPAPRPGAVVHITAQHEFELRTGENAEQPGPADVSNKGTLAFWQSNGEFDSAGQLEARITIEHLEVDDWVKGQRRKGPDAAAVKDKVLVVVFDRSGKLTGIKVPPELKESSGRVTQLLAASYGVLNFLPEAELAVNQQTTSTIQLPMSMPGQAGLAGLEAKVSLTLNAVERRGQERIAKLSQRVDVATSTSQLKISGGGTIDVNLDRGFVTASDTEWKIAGSVPDSTGTKQSPPLYGSIRIIVSAR